MLAQKKDGLDTKIVCVGDKAKTMLQRVYSSNILMSVNDVGKKTITFMDASSIANEILSSGYEFDSGEILYNRFKLISQLIQVEIDFFFIKKYFHLF